MAALPYMQLHIAEYLADTSHLSTEEHGAYLLLIFNYWQRGKALDNANERLANVVRLPKERWTDVAQALREFFTIDGDIWTHHRIERDLEAVNAKCEQARNARSQRKNYGRSTGVITDESTNKQRNPNEKSIKREEENIESTTKPSRVKTPREEPTKSELVKKRHAEFKEKIKQYWEYKNPGVEMPWGPAEGRQLAMWLAESPQTSVEQFAGFLRNRARSEVNHAERPSRWVGNVTSYANGALDTFKQPKNGALNGKQVGRTEKTLSAGAEAARDIIESGANYSTENHRETYGDDVFSSGGGEQKLFPNNVGATIEGEI
jgi:uncharacterized protein YdaU (DUF1376 family)